jgi:AraC family chitin signaling transcriptional activator
MRSFLFYLSLILFHITALSQSNNVKIRQYTKSDFNADPQFWAVCEDTSGTLFFGNNDGVVIFDGEHWQKVILPNNSSVRSLATGKDNIIYAGGYNEVGALHKDKNGEYRYKSIVTDLQLEGRNIENIWDIQSLGNRLILRAYNDIIITSGKTATHIPATGSFIYSALVGNKYYVQEKGHGILMLDSRSNELVSVFEASQYNNETLSALLPGDKPSEIIAITTQGSIYKGDTATGKLQYTTNIFSGVLHDQVSGAIQDNSGNLFISTVSSKIVMVTKAGEVLNNPTMFRQLQESVIHDLYRAKDNNIWVLQNNGLAYIDFKSPYTNLFNKASVYDALVAKENLYLATTQGVYYAPFNEANPSSPSDFKKLSGLQGQTWSVQLLEGDIIASHDSGLYKIKDDAATRIGNVNGFWKITPIAGREHFYLASHYNGLYLLEKKGGEWILRNKISGFNESARDIAPGEEPGTYWICHGYQGIFRIRINADYTRISSVDHFTNKNGLPNSFNVNVFKWQGETVFTTNTGIYIYNQQLNKFLPHKRLNAILDPSKNTRKLLQSGSRTWFVQDDEAGFFNTNDKNPELYKGLFLNLKGSFNRGMESIVSLQNGKMLFGTTNGSFLYAIDNAKSNPGIYTVITKVSYSRNQKQDLLPLSNQNSEAEILPNQTDILRFDYAAPKMMHGTTIEYSYMLENVDQGWSSWQNIPYKEYTHLRPGNYTFMVKSRNAAGLLGHVTKYNFTIVPKWYQTTGAYIMYGVVSILMVLGIRALVKKRIKKEREKSKREAEKSKKLLELELEQLKLQRDKEALYRDRVVLEEDVINKSKELSNYTLLLVQKKDMFAEITTDLKELKEYVKNEDSRKKLLQIFQKLNQHKIGEEYMEVFDVNFEKVHHNFFEKLKELNPSLTKRELRLCAFVKMNLSNKEISPLLGISLRGIENARYRIRKKLNVATDDNFTAFLEGVAKEAEAV